MKWNALQRGPPAVLMSSAGLNHFRGKIGWAGVSWSFSFSLHVVFPHRRECGVSAPAIVVIGKVAGAVSVVFFHIIFSKN